MNLFMTSVKNIFIYVAWRTTGTQTSRKAGSVQRMRKQLRANINQVRATWWSQRKSRGKLESMFILLYWEMPFGNAQGNTQARKREDRQRHAHPSYGETNLKYFGFVLKSWRHRKASSPRSEFEFLLYVINAWIYTCTLN